MCEVALAALNLLLQCAEFPLFGLADFKLVREVFSHHFQGNSLQSIVVRLYRSGMIDGGRSVLQGSDPKEGYCQTVRPEAEIFEQSGISAVSASAEFDGLTLQWVDARDHLAGLYTEWRELAARTGADIYLTPEWFDVWWTYFGTGKRLACVTVRKNGRLAGILPFYIETILIGPLPVKIARISGVDLHCIVFKLPLEAEIADAAISGSLSHLLQDGRCHLVSFPPASELSELLPLVRQCCFRLEATNLKDSSQGTHVVFELPGSFDEFLGRLSKKRRGQFRREVNALKEDFGMASTSSEATVEDFENFTRFHAQQWEAVGRGGHFKDWPDSAAFYTAIVERFSGSGTVRLFRLSSPGDVLAEQFALVLGRHCHWRLPARTLNPDLEKLSIGKVSLLLMLEELIGAAVNLVEAGRGEYDYKLSCGGRNVELRQLVVCANTKSGRIRYRLFAGWSQWLNLLYYRIWFLKLAPVLQANLGLRRGPLWRGWIRTRL